MLQLIYIQQVRCGSSQREILAVRGDDHSAVASFTLIFSLTVGNLFFILCVCVVSWMLTDICSVSNEAADLQTQTIQRFHH